MGLQDYPNVAALYDDAVKLVKEKGECSTSQIQRAFRIGYSYAMLLVDEMERIGLIEPPRKDMKPRKVIVP